MIRWALAVGTVAIACASCQPPPSPRMAEVVASALPADGEIVAIVERADALYVFAEDRLAIDRGGAVLATALAPAGSWADAAAIPALDGDGSWVVARTTTGELWRITAGGDVESMHDRLGLAPHVRAIASADDAFAAALDDSIAILGDRRHVARFPAGGRGLPSASNHRIALRTGDDIEVWQLADLHRVDYRVPGAITAAFAGDQLIVATPTALYVEGEAGLRRVAAPAAIHQLAVAGAHTWLATAAGVYLFDHGSFLATSIAAPPTARLFGLSSGDAVLAERGHLSRLSLVTNRADAEWLTSVQPIATRVCSRCHLPGGSAGVDLSTAAAWRADRGQLIRRVVEARTMPPPGVPFSDAERHALAAWLIAP